MADYKPVVKWAGGKSKIINQLARYIPNIFNNYHEPFVGGGALFFYLFPELRKRNAKAYIADSVEELINLYEVIRDNVEELINISKKHVYDKDYYYKIRALKPSEMTDLERASRTLYLNKTCFNGLYRVNSKGQFNVSFGDYTDPIIVNEVSLRCASEAFKYANIYNGDFELVLNNVRAGDFVYLDPPYVPLSATSDFTKYTSGSFTINDHMRLKRAFDLLKEKGCYVMLSNSDTDFVKELYSGCNIKRVSALRAINSKTTKRGAITELVILSYLDSEIEITSRAQ